MLTCEKSAITDVFTDHLLVRRGLKEWGAASAAMRTTGPIARGLGTHIPWVGIPRCTVRNRVLWRGRGEGGV